MLLLQHDEGFTKGIILNKPSDYEIDGWRVWFGGDVAEGAMFRGAKEAVGEREIICLHSLEGEQAERLSMPIIKGVAYTTLDGAKALVDEGLGKKSDFWVFVGYAGWAPKQLQGEVERDSWFLASADSGTLLKELLRQGTELPPPSTGVVPGDGLATWEKLMMQIGRSDEVERTRGCLSDRMLTEWCRVRLIPPTPRDPAKSAGSSSSSSSKDATRDAAEDVAASTTADAENGGSVSEAVAEAVAIGDGISRSGEEEAEEVSGTAGGIVLGSVLRTGSPSNRALLSDQFLHKSILLVVHELPGSDGGLVACVLNRPTANLVQFHADGKPRRCISFGGDGRLRGGGLEIDSNGLMWLGQSSKLEAVGKGKLGKRMGDSGLRRVPAMEAAEAI